VDKGCSLVDFPESVQDEEYGDPEIGSEEVGDIPVRMMLTNEDIKSVEEDDNGEVGEGEPGSEWLEWRLEDKSIAVNTLSLKCLIELHVCNADGAPGEEGGNGG